MINKTNNNNKKNDSVQENKTNNKKSSLINKNIKNKYGLNDWTNQNLNTSLTIDTTLNNQKDIPLPEDISIDLCDIQTQTQIIHGDILSIATHNIKGLKDSVNSKQILEYFHLQEIDIIRLTETHHSNH